MNIIVDPVLFAILRSHRDEGIHNFVSKYLPSSLNEKTMAFANNYKQNSHCIFISQVIQHHHYFFSSMPLSNNLLLLMLKVGRGLQKRPKLIHKIMTNVFCISLRVLTLWDIIQTSGTICLCSNEVPCNVIYHKKMHIFGFIAPL